MRSPHSTSLRTLLKVKERSITSCKDMMPVRLLRHRLRAEVDLSYVSGNKKGYYGYLYSLVFAADMYHTVFKKDPFDSKAGEKYKNRILAPGASCDESDLIEVRCGAMLYTRSLSHHSSNRVCLDIGVPWSPTERGSFREGVDHCCSVTAAASPSPISAPRAIPIPRLAQRPPHTLL